MSKEGVGRSGGGWGVLNRGIETTVVRVAGSGRCVGFGDACSGSGSWPAWLAACTMRVDEKRRGQDRYTGQVK